MPYYSPGAQAINFQRAMVFIDGTNLFHRLAAQKLRLKALANLGVHFAQGRQVVRTYLYSSPPHLEKAKVFHGEAAFAGIRCVLGDAIPTGDGNVKEKGVDALLVADLVYHAAAKNYDYAILVSADGDFARSLKRVEDFGCRTAVISVCGSPPALLRDAADDLFEATEQVLVSNGWAERA